MAYILNRSPSHANTKNLLPFEVLLRRSRTEALLSLLVRYVCVQGPRQELSATEIANWNHCWQERSNEGISCVSEETQGADCDSK